MWKSLNVENYPITKEKQAANVGHRLTKAITTGDLVLHGNTEINQSAFIKDAPKNWNNAPNIMKQCKS